MLIEFNYTNYKSFKGKMTLDLSAAKMTEFSDRVVMTGNDKVLEQYIATAVEERQ